MASAQVMSNPEPSSRKQGHLEAGKRRLEEFRKKKAEGRARKPAATGQQQATDVSQNATQTPDNKPRRPVDFDRAATSGRDEPVGVDAIGDNKTIESSNTAEFVSISGEDTSSRQSESSYNVYYSDSVQKSVKEVASEHGQGSELYVNYSHKEESNNLYPSADNGAEGIQTNTMQKHIPYSLFHETGYNNGNLYPSSHYSKREPQLKEVESHAFAKSISPEKHSDAVHSTAGYSSTSDSGKASNVLNEDPVPYTIGLADSFSRDDQSNDSMGFDSRRKPSSTTNQETNTDSAQWKSSDSLSLGFSFDFRNSSNPIPLNSATPETSTRPRRSSFLDSINVPRNSSQSHLSFTKSEKSEPFTSRTSEVHSGDTLYNLTAGSLDKLGSPNVPHMHDYRNSSHFMSTEDGMHSQGIKETTLKWDPESSLESSLKWNQDVPTAKKDENFAALEQYIEDLTQEKFSLKRDLDASRALAESLAAENSSLTESYNQQRASVNQLKSDMENLREEIKSQLLELDSIKMEYSEARLECDAADDRAKMLASEVIDLEEKALKLRSRELKLERELENSNTEITSYKKKVSSLQKERQDLQFTIDALQEEKKLLQSKLRKASGNVKSAEAIKAPSVMKDVSTSTGDLDFQVPNLKRDMNSDVETMQSTSNHDLPNGVLSSGTSSSFQLLAENSELDFEAASAAIPADQVRMIGNINSLISELALEKEELVRALNSESSQSSKLKELNKDLSRKLVVQTQRLELLTAQSMANENSVERPTDLRPAYEITPYTDEGDEVVERVLGWIMKLFPGGPSKRRPMKSL